jgi:hypothetical protein
LSQIVRNALRVPLFHRVLAAGSGAAVPFEALARLPEQLRRRHRCAAEGVNCRVGGRQDAACAIEAREGLKLFPRGAPRRRVGRQLELDLDGVGAPAVVGERNHGGPLETRGVVDAHANRELRRLCPGRRRHRGSGLKRGRRPTSGALPKRVSGQPGDHRRRRSRRRFHELARAQASPRAAEGCLFATSPVSLPH